MSFHSLRPAGRASSFCRQMARQAAVLLCTLLAASGALELHNLANHHRAIEIGALVERSASHPRIPHHFDRSEELREPACATCALQTHARGVQATATAAVAPTAFRPLDRPLALAPALAPLPASASPRGPPAA